MKKITDLEKEALDHLSYGERLRPERDWLVLLGIAAVLFCASIAVNVAIYERVKSGTGIGGASVTAAPVNTNAVTAAEKVFAARAAEESNYKNAYHFVDPSK